MSETTQRNQEAIELLDGWFEEPDDLGDEFWDGFNEELGHTSLSVVRR